MNAPISCHEADELRADLRPISSITNWIGGQVVSHMLPPITATTWATVDDVEVLRDELDAQGCRHFDLRGKEVRSA